jgi:Ca2+-binding RTX toxin-like protein
MRKSGACTGALPLSFTLAGRIWSEEHTNNSEGLMAHNIINGSNFHDNGFPFPRLIGTATHDTIYGFDGNDSLWGRGDNDVLNGGTGVDTLHGEADSDYLDGWIGDDKLYGGDGNDDLRGWTGNDQLNGGFNNDQLDGGGRQ